MSKTPTFPPIFACPLSPSALLRMETGGQHVNYQQTETQRKQER